MYRYGIVTAHSSIAEIAYCSQQWKEAMEAYSKTIELLCSNPPGSQYTESVLLTKAYLGQAKAFEALGETSAQRECAALGCATIASVKDRDATCQQLYLTCASLLE